MRILFLSPWFPFPPSNGSKIRINHLLRGLAGEHDITLLSFVREAVSEQEAMAAGRLVADQHLVPWKEYRPAGWRARLGFFSRYPRSVVATYSPQMADTIRHLLARQSYDLIIASQLTTAAYADLFGDVPALLEEVELGTYYQQVTASSSPIQHLRSRLMWAKQSAYVRRQLAFFRTCTVVSQQEQTLLRRVAPDAPTAELLPNCVDAVTLSHVVGTPHPPNTLIFTGAFTYDVNYEAMLWFVGQVWPLIKAAVPDARLVITGDNAGRPLPPASDVVLTGFIDNIHATIAGADVSIAPIRRGGGTRLKILEAMALGTSVVATSKGAEGLEVEDGKHLLLANTPATFAEAAIRLLTDAAQREELVKNGCQLVKQKYDWKTELPRWLALVNRLAP